MDYTWMVETSSRFAACARIVVYTLLMAVPIQFIQELAETKNVTIRIPCSYTDDRETYLNRPDVRAALHVPDTVQYWLPCGYAHRILQACNLCTVLA